MFAATSVSAPEGKPDGVHVTVATSARMSVGDVYRRACSRINLSPPVLGNSLKCYSVRGEARASEKNEAGAWSSGHHGRCRDVDVHCLFFAGAWVVYQGGAREAEYRGKRVHVGDRHQV